MKTIKNLMFVACAATTICACQKEFVNDLDNTTAGTVVTFSGNVDDAVTKTHINYQDGVTSFETLFTSSDVISINGVKSQVESFNEETNETVMVDGVKASDDRKSITFDVAGVTAPYFAVTGRHDKGYNVDTHTYTVQFSGTGSPQKYTTVSGGEYTSFSTGADMLAAYGESENLKFQHLSTFYAITIDPENSELEDNIKSIYIRQGNEDKIAGIWELSFEGENHIPTLTPKTLSAYIGYECGEEGLAQGNTMIVGLPAYNYPEGLIFTIKDINGKFVSYKVPASKTQHATDGGKIIPFKPDFKPASGTINSVEDWEDFAASINTGNDWDLYRWVGNGTVKLGADLEAENLTSINKNFPYTFDGDGHSIKRTKATGSLFIEVSGEVKNLTLEGNLHLTQYGSALVRTLNPGGKLTGCTNNMDITFELENKTVYLGGLVAVLPTTKEDKEFTTTISNCTNNGSIIGTSAGQYLNEGKLVAYGVAIGGIVGDVRAGGGSNIPYTVIFEDCQNTGNIKFTPIPPAGDHTTIGAGLTGIGGVAGNLRNSKAITMTNCDNTGNITISAERMITDQGMKAYSICMGGVIGCGTNSTGLGLTTTGHDITMTDCDNSGVLYNCGDNYSKSDVGNNKVYTGGIAGSLIGLDGNYASLNNCNNTGDIITYDLVTGDQEIISARVAYTAVAGGLIGYGGNIEMNNCTVNCQIGNGKRPMVAWGGCIGFLIKPFKLNNGAVHLNGYFQRISAYKMNRATIAVVPVACGTKADDVKGSEITGTLEISGCIMSSGSVLSSASDKSDLSSTLKTKVCGELSKAKQYLICGEGFTANTGLDYSKATITYSEN